MPLELLEGLFQGAEGLSILTLPAFRRFNRLWLGSASVLTMSNIVFDYKNHHMRDTPGAKIALSAAKGVIIGCPIVFLPNIGYRIVKSVSHQDANWLVPPFYLDVDSHQVYRNYRIGNQN